MENVQCVSGYQPIERLDREFVELLKQKIAIPYEGLEIQAIQQLHDNKHSIVFHTYIEY